MSEDELDDNIEITKENDGEVLQLIMQYLNSRGYNESASNIQKETGIAAENQIVLELKHKITKGEYPQALLLINDLIQNPSSKQKVEYEIYVNKYLEEISEENIKGALSTLREEITPRSENSLKLHELASLLMCDAVTLKERFPPWMGVGESRERLIQEIQKYISPKLMLQPDRLQRLLKDSLQYQMTVCRYHNMEERIFSFLEDHKCRKDIMPEHCISVLTKHKDEVWQGSFSPNGLYFASIGKDNHLIIYSIIKDVEENELTITIEKDILAHTKNINCMSWSPDSKYIATGGGENQVKVWRICDEDSTISTKSKKEEFVFKKHKENVTAVCWMNNSTLISAGIDKSIYIYNVINVEAARNPIYMKTSRVADMKYDRVHNWLYIISAGNRESNNTLICMDIKNKTEVYRLQEKEVIVSLELGAQSRYLLLNVSFKHPSLHLWDLNQHKMIKQYIGHLQDKYLIKATFGGFNQSFLSSGSEDAQIYIWHKKTGSLLCTLAGHTGTVNGVYWNPIDHEMFASVSDDQTVRLWNTQKYKVNIIDKTIKDNVEIPMFTDIIDSEEHLSDNEL